MHKVLKTILIVSIAGTSAFAQYFPVAGDKQVVLGITGNGGFIMLRKFKTETINNRYGVGFSYNAYSNKNTQSNGVESKNVGGSVFGSFTFGKQKNFNIGERFSPYVALDASINVNSGSYNNQSNIVDTLAYNKNSLSNERQISHQNISKTSSLGTGISILPVIGFNYYLAKNFAIGAECRFNVLSFNYTLLSNSSSHSEGSHTELNSSYDPNTGLTTYSHDLIVEKPNDSTTKNSGFAINGSISPQVYVTASFYFK